MCAAESKRREIFRIFLIIRRENEIGPNDQTVLSIFFFLSFWGLLNILGVERFGVVALIYSIGKANQKKKSNNKIVGSKLVSRVIISF